MATRAADSQATLAYVNLVGANDGLVFDGGGFVAQNGRMLLEAERFREGVQAVTLDIDETVDVVHGHQQLSLFNAHYDERCFLPIHVYDTATSRPVAVLLRPGKTPSGREVRGHPRRWFARSAAIGRRQG